MKRNIITILAAIVFFGALFFLSGCKQQEIYYEGKLREVSDVEEVIADKLEVENPKLDLEVNISEEQED